MDEVMIKGVRNFVDVLVLKTVGRQWEDTGKTLVHGSQKVLNGLEAWERP